MQATANSAIEPNTAVTYGANNFGGQLCYFDCIIDLQ